MSSSALSTSFTRLSQSNLRMMEETYPFTVFSLTHTSPATSALVSPREMQVLGLVCRGLTNAEVAGEVCVSENTVKGYVSSIMRKLDCDNRVKLVLKALELKLV